MNRDRIEFLKGNIRHGRKSASDMQINAGVRWYPEAHKDARDMANGDVVKGAGVIAALSPRMQWKVNISKARAACAGEDYSCMAASMRKACAILNGADPYVVLPIDGDSGWKTGNFLRNIAEPDNPEFVTIDVWAYRAALADMSATAPKNANDYAECAQAYREIAAEFGELPNVTQAIVWGWVREGGLK